MRSSVERDGPGRSAAAGFEALGTTVRIVVTDPVALPRACRIVADEVEALDRSCSRFRPDSELSWLNHAGGRPVPVGSLLFEAIEAAVDAARLTEGLVDPTVGAAVEALGYDRDFQAIIPGGGGEPGHPRPAPGSHAILLDRDGRTVRIPAGVRLDLGATAKALGADRAAAAAACGTGSGVVVGLGGDVAVAGVAPVGGWPIRVTDDHRADPDGEHSPGQTVRIGAGGLATSSVTLRRWRRGDVTVHHIVDPRTGRPADEVWRTVSVAAVSCVQANTASTAAIILGERAPAWLEQRRLPARLVRTDGQVVPVGGWPAEERAWA